MELLYTILGLFIFLIAVKYQYLRKKNRKLQPPSPPALPILGHLHLVKTAPHLALQKLSIKYGPLIFLHFGIRPFLVVSSPSLAEECLTKTNDIIFANRPESVSSKYLGYNSTILILSPYGDHWRNLRRVTTIHMFSSIRLQRFSSIWTEEIHFIIKNLFSSNSDEKTWKVKDMSSLFRELLFNVIMKIVAGKRWPSDQPGDIFSPQALTDLCDYIPILRWVGYGGLEKGVISLHQKRDEFLQGLIDQTRKEEAEDGSCSTERRKTIIQKLLSLQEEEPEYYTDEIVKGIIQIMLSAGTHTTSQTMEWALSSLLNHPNVLQKARDELEKMQPGHLLNDSDLSKLPYLRCIINETLRLFPAAPTLVPHFSSEDCTIGGYKVPKGTTLLVNAWAIHRDPNVWEEPNKYKPERFEGMDEGGWNEGFKFLPFGKGRRICPGAAMAIRLVGLTLGTLIQCFEWERAGPEMVDLDKVEVSPRDIIYTQPAVPLENEQPIILHKLDLRYGGISWCDDSLALVYESWYKTRKIRTWVISPGSREDISPRILFDRSSEDVYSDPGSPMLRRTSAGTYVIAKVKNSDDEGIYVLLSGIGATPEGNIPFLDLFDINTGNKERIWQSDKDKYYETIVALMSDQNEGELYLNQLKILSSKESKTENTQYFILSWPEKKPCQITNFPHPYPQLASLQKEMIRYQRKDGVQLTATLYLPPGYDPSKDGPLPCLVWSYPGEFKSKDAAGQVRGSPNEFAGIGPTSPLLWLARRFAVLSGPTIPIIGEGDEEANDRYVEQLVASAEAAVEEVICRGVARAEKIAIGGHSYGAFMAANLLAHAPHLFCCGIARSGAYNRTLTPFGFQNEDRTLWEATTTYVEMSPFMSAHKIKKPILLIHGEEDNNPGTLTMQSDRFFNALKGHGALSRLVILPFESHGYAARESIMHVLWETDRWLQTYCVLNSSVDSTTCTDNIKGTEGSESKVVDAAEGVRELEDQQKITLYYSQRSSL